jgi:hypothetical protein
MIGCGLVRRVSMNNLEKRKRTIPENPPPIITISASEGKFSVLRKSLKGRVSAVQNEVVGLGTGARLVVMSQSWFNPKEVEKLQLHVSRRCRKTKMPYQFV